MDGATLLRSVRETLGEASSSAYLSDRTTYQYLWDAACELNRRVKALRATQTITTVANQAAYALNADFLELYLADREGDIIIKYDDGGSSSRFLKAADYDLIVYANLTNSVPVPDRFAIIDKPDLYTQVTGTATAVGATSAGKSTLTDTAGLFTTSDYISAGDTIHNTTGAASGVILSVASATALETSLFDNATGASEGWAQNDAYVVQPQGRLQLVLDPPPSTGGHTITVYYLQRPAPVFHDYGVYRFQPQYQNALVDYAAGRYKYRDKEPSFAATFMQEWASRVGVVGNAVNAAQARKGFGFNFGKRER